jgi:hypothetical protein
MGNFYPKNGVGRNAFYRGASTSIVPQCLSRGTSPSIKERRFVIADG